MRNEKNDPIIYTSTSHRVSRQSKIGEKLKGEDECEKSTH